MRAIAFRLYENGGVLHRDETLKLSPEDKAALNTIVSRIIERGRKSGVVRKDLTMEDYGMMMCGITATMHFMSASHEWRRHLALILDGLRAG